jgi:hypothetical protein
MSQNLLVSDAKTHVLRLYEQKYAEASYDLAHSIEVIVHDVLDGRLSYEFIQNADDASLTNHGSLTFSLRENILTISHEGKHFSPQDVEKICAVAQQKHRDKIEDHEMIGQKGIGVKVAFSEAYEMIVYSSPYCFRFQENYKAWETATREKPYPWQITPIWTDVQELPDSSLDPKKVHFILKLRKPESIRQQLDTVLADSRILLFLNRIRRLSILGHVILMEIQNSAERKLYLDGREISSWIYFPDPVPVVPTIRQALQAMDHRSCPDKLKKPDYSLKLFFAFSVDESGLIKTENTVLSCYLPTTVRCKLPFLVNADFLLEASRQRLKVNFWNRFILEQVAMRHFYWLSKMALDPRLRKGILNVLGPPLLEGVDPSLAEGYKTAFQEHSRSVQFIPSQQDINQLRSLVSCYVDNTGFFRLFHAQPVNEHLLPTFVNDQLDNVTVLPTVHRVPIFDFNDLIHRSKTYLGHRPQLLRLFLEFFMTHWDRAKNFQFQFRQQCMLPNGYDSMSPILEFFLTTEHICSYPDCLKIPTLPTDCQSPQLKAWLQSKIGLRYLSPKEIIRGPLPAFVKEGKVDASNTLSILRFLYTSLLRGEIKDHELPSLDPTIPLLSEKGRIRPANELYLADFYHPSFSLEKLAEEPDLFISTKYLQEGDDIKIWRTLFLRLGVKDQIVVEYPPSPRISHLKHLGVAYLQGYLDYLYKDPTTSPLRSKVDNSSHILLNFVYVPFMHLLHIEAYAHHFWAEILRNWNILQSMCIIPQYKHSNSTISLKISYLQYVVKEMPLCANQGEPLPGRELYAPLLKELVGAHFPVANIPYIMSVEQARFFGFKTEVNPFDCLIIFEKMRSSQQFNLLQYMQLLEDLIKGFDQLDPIKKGEFQKKERFIVAEDGSWQKCDQNVKCSLVPETVQRFDRSNRVKIVLPLDRMERLSSVMGFGIISPLIEVPGAQEDEIFTQDLRKKLPLIALCEALHAQKEPLQVLRELSILTGSLQIFQVSQILLSSDPKDTTDIHLVENKLYYQKNCIEKKSKLGRKLCIYFQLSLPMQALLPEILSLKETTLTAKNKGIPDFLHERGIPIQLFNRLKEIYLPKECKLVAEVEEKRSADVPPKVSPKNPLLEASPVVKPVVSRYNAPLPKIPSVSVVRTLAPDAPAAAQPSGEQPNPQEVPFEPVIDPDKVDFKAVNIHRIKPIETSPETKDRQIANKSGEGPSQQAEHIPSSHQPQRPHRSGGDLKRIGQWGEKFIFHYFMYKFTNHPKLHFMRTEEIKDGVKIICLDDKKEELSVRLIWLNRTYESFEQRDLNLTWVKGDKVVKQRWVEVKTSVKDEIHFFLSRKEWEFMNSHLAEFRIYHVANIETSIPVVTKIKNLFSNGLRVLNTMEFAAKSM